MQLGQFQCLTNAPVDYDYGWTKTVRNLAAMYKNPHDNKDSGKVLRLVQVEDEYHFKSQCQRYGSGNYMVIDTQKRLDEEMKYDYIKPIAEAPTYTYSLENYFNNTIVLIQGEKSLNIDDEVRKAITTLDNKLDPKMEHYEKFNLVVDMVCEQTGFAIIKQDNTCSVMNHIAFAEK